MTKGEVEEHGGYEEENGETEKTVIRFTVHQQHH